MRAEHGDYGFIMGHEKEGGGLSVGRFDATKVFFCTRIRGCGGGIGSGGGRQVRRSKGS